MANEYETSLHLYQPPLYQSQKGNWFKAFFDAAVDSDGELTWDIGAIMSILSFSYPCGDRTLIREIKRQPWLSKINDDGKPVLENIPEHGLRWQPVEQIAQNLCRLLCDEAIEACHNHNEVYILLSGGLDSRIVGGVLHRLLETGQLSCKVTAVTWGLPDSRDVHYGRAAASIFGFEWHHIPLSPEDVMKNIDLAAGKLGGILPAHHLHAMSWFKNVPKDALVLAGSYGDSVGRAEYSGKNLLQLNLLRPANNYGILNNSVLRFANEQLSGDLRDMHSRTPGVPRYVLCEHEQEGHYMRSMLGHAMSIIDEYAKGYQMFTHPKVYSYMWSIHPALRNDEIYAALLPLLHPRLLELPWSRTNCALKGKTTGNVSGLSRDFHDYKKWVIVSLFEQIHQLIDEKWFIETGIFDVTKIISLSNLIKSGAFGTSRIIDTWLWLATFRQFAEYLKRTGKTVSVDRRCLETSKLIMEVSSGCTLSKEILLGKLSFLSVFLKKIRNIFRKVEKFKLKREALRKYPPQVGANFVK